MCKHRPVCDQGRSAPNRVRWASVVAVLFSTASVAGGDIKPPKPNPADPVDYVNWIDNTFGSDIGDNAYDAYLEAYRLAKPFAGNWGDTLAGPWSDNSQVADWLSANDEALELFRRATKRSRYYMKITRSESTGDARTDGAMMFMSLPNLRLHRDLAKGLIAEGYRAWESGDPTLLPRNALAALRSGRHFCTSPTLIAYMIGVSVSAPSYEAFAWSLKIADKPAELAARFVDELAAGDPPFSSLANRVLIERVFAWDLFQRVFLPAKKGNAWIVHEPMLRMLAEAMGQPISKSMRAEIARIGFDKTLAEVNAYFDGMLTWVGTPYYSIAPADREAFRHKKFEHILVETKNPLVKRILQPLVNVRRFHEQITALRRATHLTVLLFDRHPRIGGFPKALKELDVANLAQLRIDPFSGKDFIFKRGRSGFKLWSVGHDGVNNDGIHAPWGEDGDYVIWPPQPWQR